MGEVSAMLQRLLNRIARRLDVEMWQKGWWMLLLILGTIGLLFAICCITVFGYKG